MKKAINKYSGWFQAQASLWTVGFTDFLRARYARWHLGSAGILNLVIWVFAILIKRYLGNKQVIMHSNIVFGIDQIADSSNIFWLPVFALLVIVLNVVMAFGLSAKKETILRHLLLGGAIVVNLFVLIAIISIYRINYVNLR